VSHYLLDTNIIIFFIKGKFNLDKRVEFIGLENCFISEITIAEMKFGAANSHNPEKNKKIIIEMERRLNILPIYNCLDIYAEEKARLHKIGNPIDDFDLLIGATAIINSMILVTNNIKHFKRMKNLVLEDWTKEL
jgi:tRNA(fMet)-specific endonuclease VapC